MRVEQEFAPALLLRPNQNYCNFDRHISTDNVFLYTCIKDTVMYSYVFKLSE